MKSLILVAFFGLINIASSPQSAFAAAPPVASTAHAATEWECGNTAASPCALQGTSAQAALAARPIHFEEQSELQRWVTEYGHHGVTLFPLRRDLMNGNLMFGVSRKGLIGVYLAPK